MTQLGLLPRGGRWGTIGRLRDQMQRLFAATIAFTFNGRVRDECLNENWFTSIADARRALSAWRRDYNESRPHSSLGGLAPNEFVASLLTWAGH